MKQKLIVLVLIFIIALLFLPGGFCSWKDRLEIGISMTTADKFKEDLEREKRLAEEKIRLLEEEKKRIAAVAKATQQMSTANSIKTINPDQKSLSDPNAPSNLIGSVNSPVDKNSSNIIAAPEINPSTK